MKRFLAVSKLSRTFYNGTLAALAASALCGCGANPPPPPGAPANYGEASVELPAETPAEKPETPAAGEQPPAQATPAADSQGEPQQGESK